MFEDTESILLIQDYCYEELPDSQSIRLLELKPGQQSDTVECDLLVTSLTSAPPYEAISYVWGNPARAAQIKCSGKALRITSSLNTVLKRTRRATIPRLVWADAICINQDDIRERNQQVTIMALIYRRSECTLAWLGPDDGHAEAAFSLVHRINESIRCLSVYRAPGIQASDPLLSDPTPWSALSRLAGCTYFTRAWIQQEVGLAREVVFHWGDVEFRRDPLVRCMLYVERLTRAGDLGFDVGGLTLINACLFFENKKGIEAIVREEPRSLLDEAEPEGEQFLRNLWEVLQRASRLQATDPRDLVFAFLGHQAAQEKGRPIIEADYGETVEQAYTRVAAAELKRGNFYGLSMVVSEGNLRGRLPSWVPDLSRGPGTYYGLLCESTEYFCAVDEETHILASGNILQLRGVVLDFVVETTETMSETQFSLEEKATQLLEGLPWDHIHNLIKRIRDSNPYGDKDLDTILSLLVVGGLVELEWAENKIEKHFANLSAYCSLLVTGSRSEAHERLACLADSEKARDSSDWKAFKAAYEYACVGRKAFRTRKGYVGLGPTATQPGDQVCALFGARVPFILRREKTHNLVVGESYVHGMMRGESIEMWRGGELEQVEFEIH